ncbi:class I SAM-dependent methyltransferase [Paenibacillus chitinolyticus]
MLVTTSYDPASEDVDKAIAAARTLGGRFVPRKRLTLSGLRSRFGENEILLITKEGLKYDFGGPHALFFHPSMALVRYKRLRQGSSDPLLELSGAGRGDAVVDCTAGLASDSILFSFAVGEEGSVTAWEHGRVLAYILEQGLRSYRTGEAEFDAAMKRVAIRQGDHLDGLRAMEDNSCDIVYFDPMFRAPIQESSGLSPLRSAADDRPLEAAAVEEARRVARRCVILKEGRQSGEFERLGFRETVPTGSKLAYGVIRC